MSQSRMEISVGVSVLLGLVRPAVLALWFTRSAAFNRDTYEIRLKSGTVSGLKRGANVLVRGILTGTVANAVLSPPRTSTAFTQTK